MALKVRESPGFSRVVKRFHEKEKKSVDKAIRAIAEDPTIGEEKRGDLAGVFVYKFKINKHEVLLAYMLLPDKFKPKEVSLIRLGSHENFYSDLKK